MFGAFDDVSVVVVVSEMPGLLGVDGLATSPTVDVACLNLGHPLTAHSPEVGTVSAVLLTASSYFVLGCMLGAVSLVHHFGAASLTADAHHGYLHAV